MLVIFVDQPSGDPWQAVRYVEQGVGHTWGEGSVWNSVVLWAVGAMKVGNLTRLSEKAEDAPRATCTHPSSRM